MISINYIHEILTQVLTTPSPSGFTHKVIELVKKEAEKLEFNVNLTKKGTAIITLQGKDPTKVIGLTAHVDTLGAMVRSITSNGFLKITPIGGYMYQSIEGEYCEIFTRDAKVYTGTILTSEPSVHVFKDARKKERTDKVMEIRIDEKVKKKKEVEELGIRPGDFVSFDSRTIITPSGFIKSRHLDDKASVGILLAILEYFHREMIQPNFTVKIFISNFEEVGHGLSYLPEGISELLAIDMGAVGDDLSTTEYDVSICAKDSTGPYDYHLTNHLIELAKKHKLQYAVDIYPFYGSDASAALRAGHDVPAALIGPGVHASHSLERTHTDALVNTAKLIIAYLT
ncbi:MAG: M42 family metallopeptidase [Candidatus Hodarchaeales archaeon]|jgi:putative aminopeptidase FrvX